MVEPAEPDTQVGPLHRPKGRYFGWWIVGISAIFHGLSGGLYHTGLSVYFLQLTRDFGVSHTKLSVVFALRTLEGGVEGPVIGYLTDRLGPRVMTLAGVLIAGFGFILLATTRSFAMFILVFLAMVVVGFSMQSAAFIVAVVHWFRRRLGWALSLSSTGTAVGGFVITPALAWIVIVHGWRWAASLSGFLLLVLGLPLALVLREPLKGETARDEEPVSASSDLPTGALSGTPGEKITPDEATISQADFKVSEAMHTSTYWLLAFAIGLRLTAKSALTVHIVPILVSGGVSEGTAAMLVAFMALIRLPSMLGAGLLGDRWSRSKTAALSMVVGTITAIAMIWGPGGLVSGVMFAFFFAGAQSSDTITWALIGQYFGRKNFGSLRGGVSLLQSLMSTAGPIVAGWTFDRTGSYEQALVGVGIIYALAAFVFWTLRTPVRPVSKELARPRIS